MDQTIKDAFAEIPHDPDWLDRYLNFLEESTIPTEDDYSESHHILPRSLFPDFQLFTQNPWNRIDLKGTDHLIAHYFLLKALPEVHALRHAFCFMVGIRQDQPVPDISPILLQEMAEEYVFQKTGLRWVTKDGQELKILPHEHTKYLMDGWALGRAYTHSNETRLKIIDGNREWHRLESLKSDAYVYLPHGDQHHRRIFGCPPEVRAKISAGLTGLVQSAETIEKRRLKIVGTHWVWNPDSKKQLSVSRQGEGNNRFGQVGYWRDKHHSEEEKQKTSESLKQFNREHPDVNRDNKPRGEDHWTFGRERPEETRQKISASLTGKKQSTATKQKRAESLAMTKLPSFTPEEESIFHRILSAPTDRERECLARLISSTKQAPAKSLALGLCFLLNGEWQTRDRRYWRTAETWLKKNNIVI
jgi:hypothetical protein